MFTRPDDLSDQAVADTVAEGWGLRATSIEYLPVGFGSYHWRLEADGRPWFVTADDLTTKRRHRDESPREPLTRLRAALSTARCLRDQGLMFVVAPEPAISGSVCDLAGHFAIAVYPYVNGESGAWGSPRTRADRLAVLDLIVTIHRVARPVCPDAVADDFAIRCRDELATALADLSGRWDAGPFGEPTRTRLTRHAGDVERALARYDVLVAAARTRPERMVLTHGEPHPGNTIMSENGLVLIDWDSVLLAPPERDVWTIADGDPYIGHAYERATETALIADTTELYRLGWDLTEIAINVRDFRRPHRETADTSTAWDGLNRYLDPDRWRTD